MSWTKRIGMTTPKDGNDETHWQTRREAHLEADLLSVLTQYQGSYGLEDERFDKEIRFIQERAGFTTEGIPILSGRMAQLASEDKGWRNAEEDSSEYEPYQNRQAVNKYMMEKYHLDPVARNIINNYTFLTFGTGFDVTFATDAKQKAFDEWAEEHRWIDATKKTIRETYLWGASPTVLYPLTWGSTRQRGNPMQRGAAVRKAFRVLPDTRLETIYTSPDDYATPVAYNFEGLTVSPEDVILSTTDPIGTSLRGGGVLLPSLEDILRLGKLATSRFYVNLVRSRIPVIRNIKGAAPANFVKTLPPPGSVIQEQGSNSWTFPNHNIGASDAHDDIRTHVLRIAAGVSLPEFMVMQDASNSNYSSTISAEGPPHHMFIGNQSMFSRGQRRTLEAMGFDDFTIQNPSIIAKDEEKTAKTVEIGIRTRTMSRRSGATRLGLDYDDEVKNMHDDEETDIELFPPDPEVDPKVDPKAEE